MNIPFRIYAWSFGMYLLLTLPALVMPVIYLISACYAFFYGFVAMAIFVAVFFVLHLAKPSAYLAIGILLVAVVIAVGAAYKILLATAMQGTGFWQPDIYIAFPLLAMVSGWAAIGFGRKEIIMHFQPQLAGGIETLEGYDTIFTYDKTIEE